MKQNELKGKEFSEIILMCSSLLRNLSKCEYNKQIIISILGIYIYKKNNFIKI